MNIETIQELFPFNSEREVYVLVLLARKKYNPNIRSEEVVFRDVVRKKEDFPRKLKKMETLMNYEFGNVRKTDFNLYITFNPRDVLKAYRCLKQKFADWDFNGVFPHVKKINGEWFSCLQKPENKARRQYFLVDIDTEEDSTILEVKRKLKDHIVFVKKTRNGYHILCNPFDERILPKMENVELHKDGLFLLKSGDNNVPRS